MPEYNEIEFNGLLSKEEFFKLIEAIRRDGEIDEAEAERLVDWAMRRLSDAEIVRLMIAGFIVVTGWGDGNPFVKPTMDAIVAMNASDAEKLQEMSVITV